MTASSKVFNFLDYSKFEFYISQKKELPMIHILANLNFYIVDMGQLGTGKFW